MRLELDFCAQPSPLRYAGWLLLALGAGALASTYIHYRLIGDQILAAETRIRTLVQGAPGSSQPVPVQGAELDALRKQLTAANEVVRRLSLPWEGLFLDIEAASNEGIALLAIEPDLGKKQVRLSGEARDAAVLAGYVDRLEATPSLANVHISQHELRDDQGAPSLRFGLLATWTGSR